MVDSLYHRRKPATSSEQDDVRTSGVLWGKSPRMVAGNGPACVKAFVGPLPDSETGYTFRTSVKPSAYRDFFGDAGAVWNEDDEGVADVQGAPGYVCIPVEIVNG